MDKNLKENCIAFYLTHNVGKSLIAERVSQTLRFKINKCMAATPKNVYIYELQEINTRYHNTFQFPIKIKTRAKTELRQSKILKRQLKLMKIFMEKHLLELKNRPKI